MNGYDANICNEIADDTLMVHKKNLKHGEDFDIYIYK